MSDADTTELAVTVAGITVTKSFESDEFPVPAVTFDIRSDREDGAALRLADTVPEGVPSEDLGFHPDYDSDHWSVEDGTAVFERRFEPDERFRTVYGIRTTDADPEEFMTEPALDVRGTRNPEGEAAGDTATPGRDTTQAARDVISGDATVSGLSGDDDAAEAVDLSGSANATETTTASDEPAADSTTDATGVATPDGGVGAALATELREGTLSESDRELLAAELARNEAGDVRLSHLQSRISDIEAYTDAVEEFIDENGPARHLVEDVTDRLDAIEAELDAVDDRTGQNEAAIEALDDRIERNEDDIDALDKGIADTNAEIAETKESVGAVRDDIAAIHDWRDRLSSVFGGVPDNDES